LLLPPSPQSPGEKRKQPSARAEEQRAPGRSSLIFPSPTAVQNRDGSLPPQAHSPLVSAPRSEHPAAGDLASMNRDPEEVARQWAPFTADEWDRIEGRVREAVKVRDDFVTIPFPRIAAISDRQLVAATEAYQREAAIVDPRLSHEITCAFKATAL